MWNAFNVFHYDSFLPFSSFGIFAWFIGSFFILFAFLVLALKGYALWHAAKRHELGWFIAILIFNTAGILELVYLLLIAKKNPLSQEHRQQSPIAPPPASESTNTEQKKETGV